MVRPGQNRGCTYPPEVLSPDEVERLLAAASARSTTGIRARALILTLHRGGLRIGEALARFPHSAAGRPYCRSAQASGGLPESGDWMTTERASGRATHVAAP